MILPPGADATNEDSALDYILSREPTLEFAAQVAEQYQRPLGALGDDQLQRVAVWKMEGYSNDDVAVRLGRTVRSVERKLRAALTAGVQPLTTKDLAAAAGTVRPSTREWFASARNYALFANQGGLYDDILKYLKLS